MTRPGTTEREAILAVLDRWIRQRPGLDPHNYISAGRDDAGRRAYHREVRDIIRDLHDARQLLRAVSWRASIDAGALKEAFSAYAGRLRVATSREQHTPDTCPGRPCGTGCDHQGAWTATLNYCTGQYWPTEYRRAVCAVLAYALWNRARADVPATVEQPGEHIRAAVRREYGTRFQQRWFN